MTHNKLNPACVRNSTLQCNLEAIRMVADGELKMEFPADNCCDMRGAIKLATDVMPSCWRIVTMQGGHADTVYTLRRDHWTAADYSGPSADVGQVPNPRKSPRQRQNDHFAMHGLHPSDACTCPRVVAGLHCLRHVDCICRRHRLFDHSRIWWNPANKQHEMTTEPYGASSQDLAELFTQLHALELYAMVSTESPWYPGHTVLIHIRRELIAP